MFDQLSLLETIHSAPLWFKAGLVGIFAMQTAVYVSIAATLIWKRVK